MRATADSVRAVNRLTSRWAATAGPDDTVFSATGVWPLLALLADAADGPARAELEDAVGMRGDHAADAARRLLAALATVRGSRSAVGLWVRRVLPLRPEWTAEVPADCLSVLAQRGLRFRPQGVNSSLCAGRPRCWTGSAWPGRTTAR
ncbi:hypothetical protein [Streptomyces sp. NBC_01619]|uniref:hypothetical protein n=1 Tax=Streptomyces sp. NBC_01619 TaxID=2975901 RepID=UPI002B1CABE4|nr:hypothetical protein [Streptomyces sp. NBC_01619]